MVSLFSCLILISPALLSHLAYLLVLSVSLSPSLSLCHSAFAHSRLQYLIQASGTWSSAAHREGWCLGRVRLFCSLFLLQPRRVTPTGIHWLLSINASGRRSTARSSGGLGRGRFYRGGGHNCEPPCNALLDASKAHDAPVPEQIAADIFHLSFKLNGWARCDAHPYAL